MGFWHRYSGSRAGAICIERWIRRHDAFEFVLSARRENRNGRVPKGIEVKGPGFLLRIAAITHRLIPGSYGYTME